MCDNTDIQGLEEEAGVGIYLSWYQLFGQESEVLEQYNQYNQGD